MTGLRLNDADPFRNRKRLFSVRKTRLMRFRQLRNRRPDGNIAPLPFSLSRTLDPQNPVDFTTPQTVPPSGTGNRLKSDNFTRRQRRLAAGLNHNTIRILSKQTRHPSYLESLGSDREKRGSQRSYYNCA